MATERGGDVRVGAILEGPNPDRLAPISSEALQFLVVALKDESTHVRDTTAWTIGRVFEFVHSSQHQLVTEQTFPQVLQAMMESLKDVPHVAGKVCYSIQSFIQAVTEDPATRHAVTPYFQNIIQTLVTTSERADAEVGLKMECYEAMNEIIRSSTSENYPIIGQLIPYVLQKLAAATLVDQEQMSAEMRERQADAQALLCGTLQVIVQTLSSASDDVKRNTLGPHADNLMQAFLAVFGCRSSTCTKRQCLRSACGVRRRRALRDVHGCFHPVHKIRIRKSRGAPSVLGHCRCRGRHLPRAGRQGGAVLRVNRVFASSRLG